MKKFPKIKKIYDVKGVISSGNIVVTEKIDGANARFSFNSENDILFGTRNTKQTKDGKPLEVSEMNKNFRHCYKYLQENVNFEKLEEIEGYEDMTFFGESLQKHRINYDSWEGNNPDVSSDVANFIGFDIYDGTKFLKFDKVQEIYDTIGLETVPVMYSGSVNGINWDNFVVPKSEFREKDKSANKDFNKKGLAEGVVVTNQNTMKKAKIVHPQFKETSESGSGKSYKLTEEDKKANKFVNKYITKARVLKIAHKIKNKREEEKLKIEFMSELPLSVIDDVFEEENISFDRDNEDIMSKVRSKASSKCSNILKEAIR